MTSLVSLFAWVRLQRSRWLGADRQDPLNREKFSEGVFPLPCRQSTRRKSERTCLRSRSSSTEMTHRPTAFPPIHRHGVIGDRRTGDVVAADGALDWLCVPPL